ncbi:MAG: hypothetical protein IPK13_15625 [Deltaproteobacteria bacterium]|nr:hypothetical protein [Deltaproteobacteria bacterium]
MDVTSVAAYGTVLQNAEIAQKADVAVAKRAQDVQKILGEGAVQLIEESASISAERPPSSDATGQIISRYA